MSRRNIFLIVIGILLIDQVSKIWVKTTMQLDTEFDVFGDWFKIHYTENPGMAFGMKFGGDLGKMALTIFRIFAVGFIIYFVEKLRKNKAHWGLLTAMSLILAGALGNIIDSFLYGMIFDTGTTFNSEIGRWVGYNGISTFGTPGYSAAFKGCVVDMLYFPIFKGYVPDWVPIIGGDYKIFFRPIFNVADSAISVGVFTIFIFNKLFFKEEIPFENQLEDEITEDAFVDSEEE